MRLRRIVFMRMALILTVMTVLVSGAYGIYSLYHHREMTQELWIVRAKIMADTVQRFLLWDDRVLLREMLQNEVSGSPILEYAFIVKTGVPYVSTLSQGIPAAHLYRSAGRESTGISEFQDQNNNFIYDIMIDLGPAETALHLGLNRSAIDREMRPLLIMNMGISLVVIAIGVVMATILSRRTTREVDALAQAMRRYGEVSSAEEKTIHPESSEIAELIGSFKRISAAHRDAEQKILLLNAELEERVRDRTAQLTAANQELDAFAYSVSHDLRAPLRGIDGFSLALLEDFGETLNAEGKDYIRRIRAGCVRMGKLIDDLLYLSRLTRNRLQREEVDLSAIARQVAEELQQLDPSRAIEWVIAPKLVAFADPALMRAVFDNLLGNAWKFTAKQAHARIEVGYLMHGDDPVLFVKDNGAGFDMQYGDKLFKAFQRLHRAEEFEGTGIGLATVQRIIHRHGGSVWAQGEIGLGATFFFSLKEGEGK